MNCDVRVAVHVVGILNSLIRNLNKLTGRPRGGGHIQISIQLRVINVRGRLNSLCLESF